MAQSWQQQSQREGPEGYNSSTSASLAGSSSVKLDIENNYMYSLEHEALENISVCDILKQDNEHSGFLYKRAQEKMTDTVTESVGSVISTALFSKWQLRYVVLYREYVLYYKNDRSLKPKGVFSLRGYNRVVRAEDMTSANQQWAFKIIGLRSDDRTWYFGAASEREMRLWMAFFKVTMEKAIHGKARDRSLKILQDLKYNETKFLQGRGPPSPSGKSFEPGIYEDIEEPLEESSEDQYLPPNLSSSMKSRNLPIPPRKESFLTDVRMNRGPLPIIPPRPELPRRESAASTDSEDYILPQDVDLHEAELLRGRLGYSREEPVRVNTRPFAKPELHARPETHAKPDLHIRSDPPPLPVSETRQGPDGNSFRKKQFQEIPHSPNEIQGTRSALKPAVAVKPKPGLKPKPGVKPKPKPATRDLLPSSAVFNSQDKKQAEGLLYQYCEDGMYLLRLSSGQGKVLMAYHKHLNSCKHYKVFGDEVSTFSLNTDPIFTKMDDLLKYYIENALPNTTVRLSRPYPGY
ncbi:SH3 domain-binding protein 2-like isoform X1 [Asterias rubens]|uniref:SH3 domain-binding protein 2-like isoform X1 n=1 Tax=Asterias rubens TaxID=7604 RepID=UPI001455423E|nr:SH3 domain-binding protein 2-like isoform X1 [Asterias rubens]XP_033632711.1 SH3 domain-binding protein 2-like isoform X1 [Asterias rubens]XP_033632712.1 SH3 domain-binding protein 2-like isoform X1 [Asterias rubens]